jgi:hypothetical protein
VHRLQLARSLAPCEAILSLELAARLLLPRKLRLERPTLRLERGALPRPQRLLLGEAKPRDADDTRGAAPSRQPTQLALLLACHL